jgi:hypothetical protein
LKGDYKQFAIDNARMQAEPQRYEMEALAWKKLALRLAQEAAAVLDNAHWEVKFGSGDLLETLKQVREQCQNTEGDSLIAAIEGNFAGMSHSDLVLTCEMLTRGREQWRKEAEELKAKLESPGCLYADPGRGDCEHFVGLPGLVIRGQHDGPPTEDVYGKPNGWCWHCWWSYKASGSVRSPNAGKVATSGSNPVAGESGSTPDTGSNL